MKNSIFQKNSHKEFPWTIVEDLRTTLKNKTRITSNDSI